MQIFSIYTQLKRGFVFVSGPFCGTHPPASFNITGSQAVVEFVSDTSDDYQGFSVHWRAVSNRYTMGCPPVRGDNPRALARGVSYVQVDSHSITILYHHHQCRTCTSRDISC